MPPKRPPGYDPRAFPPTAVTVDLVVFTVGAGTLRVLLVRRGQPPHRGDWALPGGFVRPDEDLPDAALRELEEETGVGRDAVHIEQLRAYGDPGRDPRMRVVTVAYWAVVESLPPLAAGTDAEAAALFPVKDLDEGGVRLAFDHYGIALDAVTTIRKRLEDDPGLAARFCPPEFTITELRRVFEAVWRTAVDPANFQRQVRKSGVFRRLPGTAASGSLGGRPASRWVAPGVAAADEAPVGAAPPDSAPPDGVPPDGAPPDGAGGPVGFDPSGSLRRGRTPGAVVVGSAPPPPSADPDDEPRRGAPPPPSPAPRPRARFPRPRRRRRPAPPDAGSGD